MGSHILRRHIIAALVVVFASGAPARAESVVRVRALDARSAALLERGIHASPTLARLVHALQASDVIVHVEEYRAVALLGHELHHAWEIAQARWVTDAEAVERLYESIGHIHRRNGMTCADSAAARSTGRQVQAELRVFESGD